MSAVSNSTSAWFTQFVFPANRITEHVIRINNFFVKRSLKRRKEGPFRVMELR